MSSNDVSILILFTVTVLAGIFRGNTIVAARWILAEIDLDAVSVSGYSTRLCCGRIYIRNENPL